MIEYTRPFLYEKQLAALFHPRRWGLCEASTKSGKTVGCIAWIVERAFEGQPGWNYWWVSPGYNQSDIAFRRIKAFLTPGTFTANESPTPKITLINGTVIWFKSGENPDALFGEDVYACVVDEASRVKEDSWHAVYSTLTATSGPCRIIGNVKGRKNWFYNLCRAAETDMANLESDMWFAKIIAPDAVAAGVIAQEVVTAAERMLPEQVYRELYLAEPADDGGNPFGLQHIAKCVRGLSNQPVVAWGIDLAKKQDYLVLIGLDDQGRTAAFHRWRNVPWGVSIRRIHDIVGEDTPALVDSTGVGDPVLEQLQQEHGNFYGYNFSAASKQRLMEGLAVAIQSQEISYPDGPIKLELDSFEYEYTRTGVRYTAPEGSWDDCVCALALARQQYVSVAPGAALMEFYGAEAERVKNRPAEAVLDPDDIGLAVIHGTQFDTAEQLDNELTELYLNTLSKYAPEEIKCGRCGQNVGTTKVTDGVSVWHPWCAG
jgi:hypothetical protein